MRAPPLLSLLLLSLVSCVTAASLLAIDYGTDSFKATLVKPGVPFDVLINKDSKRKTQSVVTMRGDDRSFGGEAANLATRFPKDTFPSVKLVLGHAPTHPHSLLHNHLFSSTLSTTSRNSPALNSSKSAYPVEEILAMQFTYAKEMAEELAKEPVREAVVTVPGWFRQPERQAVLDALDLAGLRSVALVNDGTAAAVNYAMSRTFPSTPSYHLLYDFGAGSLRTTLVSLRSELLPDPLSLSSKPELKNATTVTVHGFGSELGVGGYVFDEIVRDIMKEDFESSTGKKIGGDPRAMAKLLREAARVKQVLSANTESSGRVEGLYDDTDLRTVVTREQFESRLSPLVPLFTKPIEDALNRSNLTLADVTSVILIGGSSRVPIVESSVKSIVGEDKIAKNLNADEAAVMGAALFGAGITRSFRTKDIRVQDLTSVGFDVAYDADKVSQGEAEKKKIKTHLYPAFSKLGSKKTMTIRKTSDFALEFSHRDEPDTLFETRLTGISTGIANSNITEEEKANVTVKVTIELDESGLIGVTRAMLHLREDHDEATKNDTKTLTERGEADRLKHLLGKKKDGEDKSGSGGEAEKTQAELEELIKSVNSSLVVPSTVRLNHELVGGTGMSTSDKTESRKRLRDIKSYETRKLAREEARNSLEAYVYRVRDMLEEEKFLAASKDDEKRVIGETVQKIGNWIWEDGEKADTSELRKKRSEIEKLVKHVTTRIAEANERPKVIEAFKAVLHAAELFLNHAMTKESEKEKYTTEELAALTKMKNEARDWFTALVKAQESLKVDDDPVLRAKDVEKKAKEIENEVARLSKKKPKRKPPKSASASKESTGAKEDPTTADGQDREEKKREHVADEL